MCVTQDPSIMKFFFVFLHLSLIGKFDKTGIYTKRQKVHEKCIFSPFQKEAKSLIAMQKFKTISLSPDERRECFKGFQEVSRGPMDLKMTNIRYGNG